MNAPTLATVNAELRAALADLTAETGRLPALAHGRPLFGAYHRARAALAKAEAFANPPPGPTPPDLGAVDFSANDDTPERLIAARHNYALLRAGWCACKTAGREAYWASPASSAHGWLCSACRKITQTG